MQPASAQNLKFIGFVDNDETDSPDLAEEIQNKLLLKNKSAFDVVGKKKAKIKRKSTMHFQQSNSPD